ncbi:unnamed protein product [Chondrus crispus]|uniref:Uncharacterized protein n=1 Tax=Chondrus crispus TaxID=2769 RepID=R7QN43_CHOCR|nr:unnamed protein product [Chondrus crispus]CDF38810.1 unnamed protein product [Chondrus crispus]|eukprot:XP_005718715.1 unnamed protein product [Chondrus crispus]
MTSCSSLTIAIDAVVPLSIPHCAELSAAVTSSNASRTTVSKSALWSSMSFRSIAKFILSEARALACSPCGPCPSNTPIRKTPGSRLGFLLLRIVWKAVTSGRMVLHALS